MLLNPSSSGAQVPKQKRVLPKPIQIVKPTVSSVVPNSIKIAQGGAAETVTVKGSNLTAISSVQVLLGGQVTPEVTAKLLDPRSATEQKVEFAASSRAKIDTNYAVRLFAGQQSFDVPTQAFMLEVASPSTEVAAPVAARPVVPKATQVRTPYVPGQRKPTPMRWSPVSMRNPDPNRPINPVLAEKGSTTPIGGELVKAKTGLAKLNTRPPIPFKPFEMKDPDTGKPVEPNTLLKTPFGETITAQVYYDELNWLEQNLNNLGYSLDRDQDPLERVDLGMIPAPAGQNGANVRWDRSFIDKIRNTSRVEFQRKIGETRKLIAMKPVETKQLTKQSMKKTPPVKAEYKVELPTIVEPEYGEKTPYNKVLETAAFKEGNSYLGAEATARAELSADTATMQVQNQAALRGSLVDTWFDIIRVTSMTYSPVSNGEMRASCTLYMMGMSFPVYNQQRAVPAGPLTQMGGGVPSLEFNQPFSREKSKSVTFTFYDLGIPFSVTLGADCAVGVDFVGTVSPIGIQNHINPYAAADAFAQVAIDGYFASVGVGCDLNLISGAIGISGALTRDFIRGTGSQTTYRIIPASDKHVISSEYYIYRTMNALSGNLYVFLKVRYPCWKGWRPGMCSKTWDFSFADWPGWGYSDYLVPISNDEYTLGVYHSGQIAGYDF